MKFFISGQIGDAVKIRKEMDEVEKAGHEITFDWTKSDIFLKGREAKLKNKEETGLRAINDIQGVIDCDIYVMSTDNKEVGKGMYAELGAALALNQTTGKPEIYIIGAMNHISVFYLHPAIKHKSSIQEVISEVASPLS